VYVEAADLGFSVVEVNASDERRRAELEALLRRVRTRGFRKLLYLLDEVDGIRDWELVQRILANSVHPVVLVANDEYRVPKKVKDFCVRVRFYRPRVAEVVERVRQIAEAEGMDVRYGEVSGDVRASINAVMYGGERYEVEDKFDMVNWVLRGGGVEGLEEGDFIWLMDNLHRYYRGRDLYEAVRLLALAARTREGVLKVLPRGRGRPLYPYYLRRVKVLRGGGK